MRFRNRGSNQNSGISLGKPASKKAKMGQSGFKFMTTAFRDTCDIVYIDYIQKEGTINSEYYVNLLEYFNHDL